MMIDSVFTLSRLLRRVPSTAFLTPIVMACVVMTLLVVVSTAAPIKAVASDSITFIVNSFTVEGDNPLDEKDTSDVLAPFTGASSSLEKLQSAALALEQALRNAGYTFFRVTLPPQKLQNDSIRLEVKSFPIGKITVEGNEYFTEENILRSIPELRVGHSPNVIDISKSLSLANKNPSKNSDVTFAVNTETGELEARVKVVDKRPIGGFAWLDNTGSDRTGNTRLGVGFQHSNMLDRDHIMTFTATTSPEEVSSVQQFGLNYRLPVTRSGGHVDLVLADSNVDSGTVAEAFEVKGEGRVTGIRYMHPLTRKGAYRQHVQASLFDKRFENDISFDGTPIGSTVRSRPVGVEYHGNWSNKSVSTSFYVGHYRNLSGGANNNDEAYAAVRSGATPDWSVNRFGGSIGYSKNKWVLVGKFDAQSASEPLIPGEQFATGGIRTVRGFSESELTDDDGYRAGVELWAPPMKQGFRILGFADFGSVKRIEPLAGERLDDEISSIGFGVRWGWRDRLRAQLDYGYVLDGIDAPGEESTRDGDSKLHFSVFYSF